MVRSAVCLQLLLTAPIAAADGDPGGMTVDGQGWDDLGDLVALSAQLGFPAQTPDRLELWRLPPQDSVIIVHPTAPPPPGAVDHFVRNGGRLALLDDFGQGQSILRFNSIGRHAAVRPPEDRRIRGNPKVAIATPAQPHPLTTGIEALVTNHTAVLYHSELQPVFALDDGASAVVLSGGVGTGRLVAVGDASVVINNMLRFRGNRRFAENLIRYLMGDRGGQLWIVTGDTPIIGRDGSGAPDHPLTAVRKGLERLADLQLPPRVVWLSSWMLACILLLAAAASLPRKRGPGRPAIEEAPVLAGYEGRIGFFSQPRRNLFGAVMAYKYEFESELVRRLGLTGRPSRKELVLGTAQRAGAATAASAEALLVSLDAHALQKDRAPAPPRISAASFSAMVEDGQRVLSAVEPSTGTKHA